MRDFHIPRRRKQLRSGDRSYRQPIWLLGAAWSPASGVDPVNGGTIGVPFAARSDLRVANPL